MTTTAYTLFISDLHLEPRRIDITLQFIHFMRSQTGKAEAIYILGDFFNAFIGEDDDSAYIEQIKAECLSYTKAGGKLYLMMGNRDFLMQQRFAGSIGATYINDPTTVEIYGLKLLLTHGDALCTDDISHQRWRRVYTQPWANWVGHAIPLKLRQKMARRMRRYSISRKQSKASKIMDVNAAAVAAAIKSAQADYLIHGHTHLPNDHGKRLVLGAWPDTGAILQLNAHNTFIRLDPSYYHIHP